MPPCTSTPAITPTRMSWRCAGASTRYQEGSRRIPARHLEIFCRLVAISPPTYRYLYRGTAASPALAGCFHHQSLSNFVAGRLASRLRVRHTHDELVWRLGSIFDLGFRRPRRESQLKRASRRRRGHANSCCLSSRLPRPIHKYRNERMRLT